MQTIQPTGHHNDGSGVQKHSAGGIYPYILGVREIRCTNLTSRPAWNRSYYLTGGHLVDELPCASYDDAVVLAQGFNRIRTQNADELAALQRAVMRRQSSGLEMAAVFDRVGQHNQREWQRFAHQRNSR